MRSFANCTRVALIVAGCCALATGGVAHADTPPQDTTIPQGWVWQGVWQDGRWSGQWIPGPGMQPGAPAMVAPPPPPPGAMPWAANPGGPPMMDRCHDEHGDHHRHGHDCGANMAPRGGFAPMPYPQMPYPAMGYMMVPVITQPQQAPCVETRTVTTEYVVDTRRRVIHAKPHRKEKRVYTGS